MKKDIYSRKNIDLHNDILQAFDVMAALKGRGTKSKQLIEEVITEYAVKNGPSDIIASFRESLEIAAAEEKKKRAK